MIRGKVSSHRWHPLPHTHTCGSSAAPRATAERRRPPSTGSPRGRERCSRARRGGEAQPSGHRDSAAVAQPPDTLCDEGDRRVLGRAVPLPLEAPDEGEEVHAGLAHKAAPTGRGAGAQARRSALAGAPVLTRPSRGRARSHIRSRARPARLQQGRAGSDVARRLARQYPYNHTTPSASYRR